MKDRIAGFGRVTGWVAWAHRVAKPKQLYPRARIVFITRRKRSSKFTYSPRMENTLPKLAEVTILMYLIVLTNLSVAFLDQRVSFRQHREKTATHVLLPCKTPCAITSRLFSNKMTSAASLAISVPESTEIPHRRSELPRHR